MSMGAEDRVGSGDRTRLADCSLCQVLLASPTGLANCRCDLLLRPPLDSLLRALLGVGKVCALVDRTHEE